MRLQVTLFLTVLCASLTWAISCDCELGHGGHHEHKHHQHHRRNIRDEEIVVYDNERPYHHHHDRYPYHKYGSDSVTLTETGKTGSVSETISSSRTGHIHEHPRIPGHSSSIESLIGHNYDHHHHHDHDRLRHLHESPLYLSHVLKDKLYNRHQLPYEVISEHKVVEKEGKTIDKELVEVKVDRPSVRKIINGEVYEKIIAPRDDFDHYGHHLRSPRLEEIEIRKTNLPGKKIVDVEVIKNEPLYEFLPHHHRHHHHHPHHHHDQHHEVRSGDVLIKEKVKLPSVALKERETIYLGGEHHKSHYVSADRANAIFKKVHSGCGCRHH